ncbi:MAG: hypothetical protein ACI82G_001429, partial [Bradymonadia bacterium]
APWATDWRGAHGDRLAGRRGLAADDWSEALEL